MTHSKQTAVDEDIISRVASGSSVSEEALVEGLTVEGGPSGAVASAVSKCYELQSIRNDLEPEIQDAATSDTFHLVDSDGYVFWVDNYDGFGAYIHAGDGDTYYVSLSKLQQQFSIVRDN